LLVWYGTSRPPCHPSDRTDTLQVVEKHSALLEVDREDQVPVNTDHSQICKFENEDDDTFEKTWKRIERMRKENRAASTEQTGM